MALEKDKIVRVLKMREIHFNVFGRLVALVGTSGNWSAFLLGSDGKRRPAGFIVPNFLAEEELGQYLADLFHESTTPSNNEVFQIYDNEKN
jgi:hypothetical protein